MTESIAETKNNTSSGIDKLASEIARTALVPTALVSTLGYFLGWSVNAAYYLTFGLSPSFVQKSVPEILTSAWIELAIGALGLVVGVAIYRVIGSWFQKENLKSRRQQVSLLLSFFLAFGLSTISGLISLYILLQYRIRLRYLALTAISIILLWIASVLGNHLYSIAREKMNTKPFLLYRFLFPSFYVYFIITILASIFFLSRVGIWRGVTLAERDISDNSHLPNVILYSQKLLPIQGRYDITSGLYVYEDLKLIDSNDMYMFVLEKPLIQSNSLAFNNIHVYVVSKEKLIMFQLSR